MMFCARLATSQHDFNAYEVINMAKPTQFVRQVRQEISRILSSAHTAQACVGGREVTNHG